MKRFLALLFLLLAFVKSPLVAQAQTNQFSDIVKVGANATPDATQEVNQRPNIVTQVAVIALLSLLPYFVILLTAFIKIVIVLSLLRNALGVQQSPPNQVINGLALILSIYVMYPTGLQMYNAAAGFIQNEAPQELISSESAAYFIGIVDKTKDPLKGFLERNTTQKHIKSFYTLAEKVLPDEAKGSLKPNDFLILVPSYITSQLKDAYEIGVLIYLPFFVIDLVVSNILLAMGMMMLSPLTIALPLKLLLLVMLDGWTVLIQGLVLTFR